ncbi:MAG: SgcJ/EcaC family oxidoreductase [Desulfobacterales bacterium]|nr:MAG: SgcJ/EcaC family oxidoreductase [Desulfobacterales bacterium]UCD91176.1 MAG: SgcJ/EcaC family oxidoreductase [Desulfobacterales bacterium]
MSSKKTEISDQFAKWNNALQTGNPDAVVACYAEDAILLPTVSAKVRHNHDEIRDYFVHFLTKKPHGKITEENIRIYDNIAISSGLYTFSLTENGDPADVAARFTFVYKKYDDGWLIVDHHSSILPA